MRVVMSWLEEYIDLSGVGLPELCERWTLAGLEVERVEHVGDWWDRERLLVGAIVRVEPHPNADRLVLAYVDHGAGTPHRVVTGAPNLLSLRHEGDLPRPLKVAFAREGAELFDGHQEGWVKTRLKGRAVRGIPSDAMVCSEKELGLSDDHSGILVLDTDAAPGVPLADVLADAVVEMDLTANLARAMNMVGIARETAAILDRPYRAPAPVPPPATGPAGPGGDAAELVDVVIEAPDLCPRYTARVVRHVTVGPSPGRLARRLRLAGMRPINNVVDATNYAMLEWGEPLHAFDYGRLQERAGSARPRITVRRARAGERMVTLDLVDRALDEETLLICDDAGPLAIAGVMGGRDSEVTAATTDVLLEAAAFDFISIRRTSRVQKLPSESAARFGRGVHPALTEAGSARACGLLHDMAGGATVAGSVDAYPRPPAPVTVTLPPGEIERVLGVSLPPDRVRAVLERLEFTVEPRAAGGLEVTVPPHRMDVALAADLLEEIARVHGYDRLPSTLLAGGLPVQRDNERLRVEEAARDALVLAGLHEVISYRLVSAEREAGLDREHHVDPSQYVTLANPISPERASLRRSILTGLLEAVAGNLRFTDRAALFEVGPVFHARPDALPHEPRRVGMVLTGPHAERSWRVDATRHLDFYDAKGAVETLLERLGIRGAQWRPDRHASMHPARTARVQVGETAIGHVGELHPRVREHWDLGDRPVAVADLDLEALQSLATGGEAAFVPLSPYPPSRQDLALIVDDGVPAADVETVIREAAGPLLADLELFDVYRGPQAGPGRKSLAWSLTFQAPDRTLESEQTEAARERIVGALRARLGAEPRA